MDNTSKHPPPAVDWSEAEPSSGTRRRFNLVETVRAIPIRWRILSIAALNSAVVLVLAAMIWTGAKGLNSAWNEVRQVRESDRVLAVLESETSRLQNLIHRYINQPSDELFAEILLLREAVLGTLATRAATDPILANSVDKLEAATEKFLDGFGELRAIQATIAKTYDDQILSPSRDMAGLYAIIEASLTRQDALLRPTLGKSREAFTATLVAANAYYLSLASESAEEARRNAETIEKTVPVMIDLADSDLQRTALQRLSQRIVTLRNGLARLSEHFASRTSLLRNSIDANQAATIAAIDDLSVQMRAREQAAQTRFDHTLTSISRNVASVLLIFLTLIIAAGIIIALSIRLPLRHIMTSMQAITSGDYGHRVRGISATDEIGEMARAVEVFRANAIDKAKAEEDLRTSKEAAETSLAELKEAQQNLIDAERLAALGGLVAGVAHEVNNPIGISLTVASSLAGRSEAFTDELNSNAPMRRSRLLEFIDGCRDASQQLVANLQRAGDLIQSFKQVAVDRSHAERRQFDLHEATEQIIASLRPILKKRPIELAVNIPEGLGVDSYPGAYGQVLTNLVLNALTHAFPDDRVGHIVIAAKARGKDEVELTFTDDGIGMSADVLRQAFNPFFTTRRNEGGTGLGLHIVYTLVTQQLGGRLALDAKPGQGTRLRIVIPRVVRLTPLEQTAVDPFSAASGSSQWMNKTMSST